MIESKFSTSVCRGDPGEVAATETKSRKRGGRGHSAGDGTRQGSTKLDQMSASIISISQSRAKNMHKAICRSTSKPPNSENKILYLFSFCFAVRIILPPHGMLTI